MVLQEGTPKVIYKVTALQEKSCAGGRSRTFSRNSSTHPLTCALHPSTFSRSEARSRPHHICIKESDLKLTSNGDLMKTPSIVILLRTFQSVQRGPARELGTLPQCGASLAQAQTNLAKGQRKKDMIPWLGYFTQYTTPIYSPIELSSCWESILESEPHENSYLHGQFTPP